MSDTKLTSANGYDVSRMLFSDPQVGTIPDSKPSISYKRINISTRNSDGTVGELIFPTERLFSFGVCENLNPDTGKVNGYVMPLCLWNKDGASKEEKAWTDTFNNVVEACKDHLIKIREEIEQYELERNDLKKFNPLYYKRDKNNKGKILTDAGPTLYAKLITSKKQDKIVTTFFGSNNEELNAMDLVGKYCYTRAAIKIESIFIGNKLSMQVKLYECEVQPVQSGMRRLLDRPQSNPIVQTIDTGKSAMNDDEDIGSLNGSDEETQKSVATPQPRAPSPPKVVKKVIKRVVRKSGDDE
uniref:Uncharacterized protein n=1 Tax=viral metagenome TaxID=1070528 RepID=A0A6C0D140_9ZZZZ